MLGEGGDMGTRMGFGNGSGTVQGKLSILLCQSEGNIVNAYIVITSIELLVIDKDIGL